MGLGIWQRYGDQEYKGEIEGKEIGEKVGAFGLDGLVMFSINFFIGGVTPAQFLLCTRLHI
jgi:hypothetical protein